MTAIGEAFEKAGLRPRDVAFDRSIAIYLNSGGTIEEARQRVELAAKRMPGMDQTIVAQSGPAKDAQTRQQVDDGEAVFDVPKGQSSYASPSSPVEDGGANQIVLKGQSQGASPSSSSRGGGDQLSFAHKSHDVLAPPVREPTASYLKAAGESRLEAARSILYRYTTSTGKFWGDVHPYEVGSMTRDHLRGMALMSALGPLSPKQMKMTFAQLMTPKKAEIAMQNADKELVNV